MSTNQAAVVNNYSNMDNTDARLKKVKESCKTTATVFKVFEILAIVMMVIFMIGAIPLGLMSHDEFNQAVLDTGTQEVFRSISISFGIFKFTGPIDADYAMQLLMLVGFGALIALLGAVIMHLLCKTFKLMADSESPFADSILKRIKGCFIILTVVIAMSVGIGFGLLCGLVFWSFFRILEYGALLQQQVDETL